MIRTPLLAALLAAVIALPTERPAEAQPPKSRKVAFLVGVGTYDHAFADLGKLPENDVTELAKEFKAGGFDVVTLLGSKPDNDPHRATKANVEARYKEVVDGKQPLRNGDTLVVVLCGHGLQADEPLFCPVNARPGDPKTMVRLNGLLDATKELGATCLFLVDACREDPNRRARTGIQGKQVQLPKKTAVLFSCGAGQLAYQDKAAGHGVFTFAVLKTIRAGNGTNWGRLAIGVQEAFEAEDVKKMLPAGEAQTPVLATGELGFTALLPTKAVAGKPADPPPGTASDMAKKDGPEAGEEREFEIAPGVKMVFCWIPATTQPVQLGSPKAERDFLTKTYFDGKRPDWLDDESEERRPKFTTKGFWLGKYEVTQDEWTAVMGSNPSYFDGAKDNKAKRLKTGRFPVENVSWDDICKTDGFLDRVNARPRARTAFGKAGRFVLPHEDEWEYACRGGKGNGQAFYWGNELDGSQANCDGNYAYNAPNTKNDLERTCAVDDAGLGYPKHPWNLCHMHGNVWEWCDNKYKQSDDSRVLRGGSWDYDARHCRAACRNGSSPDLRLSNFGFRLCFRLD